jgi:serine-type D-Ala-D-Ala endopeptidase (penicillin-binding protein 7)
MDFLPHKHKRRSFHIRYLTGFFAAIVVIVGIGLYEFGRSPILLDIPRTASTDVLDLSPSTPPEGGDIVYEPPPVEAPQPPQRNGELPPHDQFSAKSVLVKDVTTGAVLYEKEAYKQVPIASLTKLMSALVVLERHPEWATTTQVVSDELIDTHMYAGDTYTLQELWDASLIASSNKAIMTLADAVGWNRASFVARMNERAVELGMGDTYFLEPTGLNAANVSTASDLTILLQEALSQPPIQQGLLTEEYTIYSEEREKEHHMWNTNWLVLGWIPNNLAHIIGGKTGFIPASGYNYVMNTSNEAGNEISVVILGASAHEQRFTEARDIADHVFDAYEWK